MKNPMPTEPLLRREMPELDTIRGLAILGVLLYHGLYWNVNLSNFPSLERIILTGMWAGRMGVDLFFVLSGFLITGILLDSRNRQDYYRRFYARRALRILPAYLLILAILAVTKYTPLSFVLLSLIYLSNLTPLFGIPIAYPVLWSLGS
jgi:peptidoglycan/LPS O-acetylase OafA/YrhL